MIFEFTVDKARDPDGIKLRRLLEAHLGRERMCKARCFLVHLLAISGSVLWVASIWPNSLGPEVQFIAVATFGGFLILTLGILIEEIVCCVRLKHYLKNGEEGQTSKTSAE